jgi:hypothetical protein
MLSSLRPEGYLGGEERIRTLSASNGEGCLQRHRLRMRKMSEENGATHHVALRKNLCLTRSISFPVKIFSRGHLRITGAGTMHLHGASPGWLFVKISISNRFHIFPRKNHLLFTSACSRISTCSRALARCTSTPPPPGRARVPGSSTRLASWMSVAQAAHSTTASGWSATA